MNQIESVRLQSPNHFLCLRLVAGIGILDMPGCLLSGLVIRDNVVPPLETIFSTNGLNGISANLIEQNQANWFPTWSIPGFLVQDNTPQ